MGYYVLNYGSKEILLHDTTLEQWIDQRLSESDMDDYVALKLAVGIDYYPKVNK